MEKEQLAVTIEPGDVEVEISSECNVKTYMFGKSFWNTLTPESRVLEQKIDSEASLIKISYSDCYVCSPWTLILLTECLNALTKEIGKSRYDGLDINIITADKPASSRARGLYAEWATKAEKSSTIEAYISELLKIKPSVSIKEMKQMPHGRVLCLHWSDGETISVRLDHGFGCWSISNSTRPEWFDISNLPAEQVKEMKQQRERLDVSFSKLFPTQIFIKKGKK